MAETGKFASEYERCPRSRNAGGRDEYSSGIPRESGSLEYITGDEDVVGGDGGGERETGKKRKERKSREEERGPRSGVSYLAAARRVDHMTIYCFARAYCHSKSSISSESITPNAHFSIK